MLWPESWPVGWMSSTPSLVTLEVLSPRIFSPRHREEQLEAAREDAATQLEQRRVELPNTDEIKEYVEDFRGFLQEGTFPERKALTQAVIPEEVGEVVSKWRPSSGVCWTRPSKSRWVTFSLVIDLGWPDPIFPQRLKCDYPSAPICNDLTTAIAADVRRVSSLLKPYSESHGYLL